MGENPKNNEVDPELEKAQRSMAGRIDPDPVAEKEEVPAVDETPTPEAEKPKEEETTPETPPVTETPKDDVPPVVPQPKVERPEAYIPMPKYINEKKDWESKLNEANLKIVELTKIATQNEGTEKDEDIEEFMAKTGFDRETVEGFVNIAKKRLEKGQTALSPEQLESVERATAIVKEADLELAFNEEFKNFGEPEIKKMYPTASEEQLKQVRNHLDKVAHTADNRDKPLDFLIYKNKEEIAKIFVAPTEPAPPLNKKTMETSRLGQGQQVSLTASDFREGKTSFSALADLDQSVRSEIIKNFDTKTYQEFLQYAKSQENGGGVEVMRNGRKVVLK